MLDIGGYFWGVHRMQRDETFSETDNSRGSVVHSYLYRKVCTSETNRGESRLVQRTEQGYDRDTLDARSGKCQWIGWYVEDDVVKETILETGQVLQLVPCTTTRDIQPKKRARLGEMKFV